MVGSWHYSFFIFYHIPSLLYFTLACNAWIAHNSSAFYHLCNAYNAESWQKEIFKNSPCKCVQLNNAHSLQLQFRYFCNGCKKRFCISKEFFFKNPIQIYLFVIFNKNEYLSNKNEYLSITVRPFLNN